MVPIRNDPHILRRRPLTEKAGLLEEFQVGRGVEHQFGSTREHVAVLRRDRLLPVLVGQDSWLSTTSTIVS